MSEPEPTKPALTPAHQMLVRRLAFQLVSRLPPNVDVNDLVQVGMCGLMEALERYDSREGVQFETFATQRIRGAMLDELRRTDHLPRSIRVMQRRIHAAQTKLQGALGRRPNEAEMAHEMGISVETYRDCAARAGDVQLVYLEDLAVEQGDVEPFEDRRIADSAHAPLRRLEDRRLREAVMNTLNLLRGKEKVVMVLHYRQEMPLQDIAAYLGVSPGRVSQLHGAAIAKLRKLLWQY